MNVVLKRDWPAEGIYYLRTAITKVFKNASIRFMIRLDLSTVYHT